MWDFDDLKASEDEAAGEGATVYSFLDGQAHVRIRALVHPEENRPEDTSSIVWPAARALMRHLERESWECRQGEVGARPLGSGDSPENRDVLDLGAGTGLVGLSALALGARSVVVTDVACALPVLESNAEMNENAGTGTLDVMELDFRTVAAEGLPLFPMTRTQRQLERFDLICCSDCVLWPELLEPLIDTLDLLLDNENVALVSLVHRNSQADTFMELLRNRFQVEPVPLPPLAAEAECDTACRIEIARARRRPNTVACPRWKESRLDVSLRSSGGKAKDKTGDNVHHMTNEAAHAMVEELISQYSTEAFQSKLFKAWNAVKDNPQKAQAARRKVCLEVQGPIMAKYGFEDSMEGVINCLSHFYFPPLCYDTLLNKKIDHMMLQTKPWFQQHNRLQCRFRIWRSDGESICQPVVDLNQRVKELKMEIEFQSSIPWQAQRLWGGEHEVHDFLKLDEFIPRNRSDVVDLWLEMRDPEVTQWLTRLTESIDTDRQVRCLDDAMLLAPELFGNRDFVITACHNCKVALKYAEIGLRSVREAVAAAVCCSGIALQYASPEMQADPSIVLEAVAGMSSGGDGACGTALQYASPEMRAAKYVVIQAITNDAWAIQFASEELRNDKEVALLAVRKDGMAIAELPDSMRRDREVVMAAVVQNGRVLQSVMPWFQADRDIVLTAVRQCAVALQFAALEARSDREIVLTAVRGSGEMYRFAAPKLQADREVAMAAVARKGCIIAHVPSTVCDLELALAAAKEDPMALELLEEPLHTDVKAKLKQNGGKQHGGG